MAKTAVKIGSIVLYFLQEIRILPFGIASV
jgi:hypothetical protein